MLLSGSIRALEDLRWRAKGLLVRFLQQPVLCLYTARVIETKRTV
jgi:hypothetical protein